MTHIFFRLALGILLTLGIGANAQEANQAKPAGGPREGIKVHGHWTIEVRNPDGKLVTHREFENSLGNGQFTLGPTLGRTATVGNWFVAVSGNPGPCLLASIQIYCGITESTNLIYNQTNVVKSLTVSAPFFGSPGAGTLTLSGTFTVQNASQISTINTSVQVCPPNVTPASCPPVDGFGSGSSSAFSIATITPIAVTVGQLVQITVVFSFS
jgi:hypothetical protein